MAGTVIILRGAALRRGQSSRRLLPTRSIDFSRETILTSSNGLFRDIPPLSAEILSTLVKASHLVRGPKQLEAVQTRARHEVARLESGLVVLEITTGDRASSWIARHVIRPGRESSPASAMPDPVAVARGIAEALNTDDRRPRRCRAEPRDV